MIYLRLPFGHCRFNSVEIAQIAFTMYKVVFDARDSEEPVFPVLWRQRKAEYLSAQGAQ